MLQRPVAIFLLSAYAAFAELRAGRAQLNIAGELMVKALVLDDGETRAAMVVCDLASLDAATVKAARKSIASAATATSIPEFNIMIAVTGARAARLPDSAPRAQLSARIAEAVRLASASTQPVSVWVGLGREDAIGFYDRFLMKDGSVRANPGKLNPDIVQPAGEADPEMIVARFESLNAGGQTLALFGSFSLRAAAIEAAHQSADYPGVIARTLAKLHGPELVTLWSTGAGANVTHLDVRHAIPQQGPAEARRVGTVLAGEAIKAGARAEKVGAGKLGVAREAIRLAAAQPGQPGIDVEVQAIALGSAVAWVALPGDLWSELGAAIRKASPFTHTLLVGSANGAAGVLPGRKGYAALDPGVIAAAGSGETVAGAAARLLAAARRQSAGQQ
jgi:neutral ceramidase